MKDHYDDLFLAQTIYSLISEVDDLASWSAYNDDKFNEEISELIIKIQDLQKKITGEK